MNYRYRAMTRDGQKLQGSLMLTMNVRHDCGCVKKGFFLLDIRPQKVRE